MTTPATVTVWTKPNCVQCDATKRALTRRGIPYTEYRLDQNPDALNRFKTAGHLTAPIVETPDETWAGFQPARIKALAQGDG